MNAASVSGLMLTTETMIADLPKKDDGEHLLWVVECQEWVECQE
jgi:chaperonin GroEL (HSP60 family)